MALMKHVAQMLSTLYDACCMFEPQAQIT